MYIGNKKYYTYVDAIYFSMKQMKRSYISRSYISERITCLPLLYIEVDYVGEGTAVCVVL